MTLKVVFCAHIVDATRLGALGYDALLVCTMRDAVAGTTIGLIATLDHATTPATMSTAESASLRAFRAVRNRATTATAMQFAQPP